MPNYNFYDVFSDSPMRFQQFACAVISVREGCTFQRFGAGRDGAIDGLFVSENGRTVLQVKMTEAKGKALLGLMRQERKRISPENCNRYILVIASRTLRDELKEEIRKIIPEIRDTGDIVTGVDLNGFLERPEYAHIEKEYRELWLHSGNYLEEMLSFSALRELQKRSNPKFKLMEKERKTFVETNAFQEAIHILETYQRVIISGDPGIGKTAHALCLADYYICTEKYEAFYFVNSLEEIERIMGEESGEKTVIVFDDFWGHSHFSESRLELNADRKMLDLFHVLSSYPNIRLIFTTREFVLQQGFLCFPELEDFCEIRKINLRLNSYTLAQKAEILYRHLDESQLEYRYVKAVFNARESILHSDAYSPRSVAYYLEHVRPGDEESSQAFADALQKYVRSPKEYYENVFSQLSYGAKIICMLLVVSEEEIRIYPELRQGFMGVADACGGKIEKEQFDNYLRELEGVFTKIKESVFEETEVVLDFLNYSISDFMKEYLNRHIEAYEMILAEKCNCFNQLFYLASEIQVSEKCLTYLIDRMINERKKLKYSYVFSMDVNQYYSVDADVESYDAHKVWQLNRLYEITYNADLYHYLTIYTDALIKALYEGRADHEDMENIINLVPRMCKNGYPVDSRKFLEAYYKNIWWSTEIAWMKYLKSCCLDCYDAFMEDHMHEIRQRLPGLVLQDIEYLFDDIECDAKIDDLIMLVPDLFETFGIDYTKGYEKELYEAAELPLPKKSKRAVIDPKDDEPSEYQIDQENYEEVTARAESWLVPETKYLSPKEIKAAERMVGKDYRKGYLTNGKFAGDDFMIVMEYLEHLSKLPSDKKVFYNGLLDYMLEERTVEQRSVLWTAARKLTENAAFYFTERELDMLCGCEDGNEMFRALLDSGLIHKRGKWYYFWNNDMQLYLSLRSIEAMSHERKQVYYQEDLRELWDKEDGADWITFLQENEGESFKD
ncbi:ATP-binding protein [Clostridium sp. D5]|uniref:ATP-binding protein n=1 Tax=Clostridium sp. D5 TaxID=556261 RepID=UPI0001FC757A|nr:ATP-binding protein [Clostridium sp. D5]EGB94860.1 hypothetical protein HMPREF0240_01112 [Clostridium sp. D5]